MRCLTKMGRDMKLKASRLRRKQSILIFRLYKLHNKGLRDTLKIIRTNKTSQS